MDKKLLIVDGNSLANRAFYALPFLSNHSGQPSGAIFGFANILIKVIHSEKPTHIVIAFDHARKTFRNELYPEYKMQRKATPVELVSQFPLIKKMLQAMGIKTIEQEGIEADDIIGTIARHIDCKKYILSGDRDLLQLIDDNTFVWLTKKGVSEIDKVDETRLKELYNISPSQVIELKALMGDTSDNIPGVRGIGEKTAQTLINEYGNVDNIYDNIENIKGKLSEKLEEDKDMAYLSRKLATIKTDCDIDYNIDDFVLDFPFSTEAYQFFKEMDFTSLINNATLFKDVNVEEATVTKVERLPLDNATIKEFKNLIAIYNRKQL